MNTKTIKIDIQDEDNLDKEQNIIKKVKLKEGNKNKKYVILKELLRKRV